MLYNITKDEIINDHKLVTKWIVDELEATQNPDYAEPIDRIICFGNHSILELCRMVISENHELLIDYIDDMSVFLDVILELEPNNFSRYYRTYCEDTRDNSHAELYPKYIEYIANEPDFYDEEGNCELTYQDSWWWDVYLKQDITILPFALKHGLEKSNSLSNKLLNIGFEKDEVWTNKDVQNNELYNYYVELANKCDEYDIVRFLRNFPERYDNIVELFNIPTFEFKGTEKVTAYKGADGNIYETEKKAWENSFKTNRDSVALSLKLNKYSTEHREIIEKYLLDK